VIAGVAAAITGSDRLLLVTLSLGLLVLPLAGIFQCPEGWPRTTMTVYTVAAALLVVLVLAGSPAVSAIAAGVVVSRDIRRAVR